MYGETCTFCDIVAGRLPSNVHYEDDDLVVFDNHLKFVPVMLLIVPRKHMTQSELWTDSQLLSKIGQHAVRMGHDQAPDGFRIVSNFGRFALQTQFHAHVHLLGGVELGFYLRRPNKNSPTP